MKAKQLLGKSGASVTERLYFKQAPTVEEVKSIAARLPGGVRDILSTRSRRYKELNLATMVFSDEELVELLVKEPGLWRRPIVLVGEKAVIGFDAKSLEAILS